MLININFSCSRVKTITLSNSCHLAQCPPFPLKLHGRELRVESESSFYLIFRPIRPLSAREAPGCEDQRHQGTQQWVFNKEISHPPGPVWAKAFPSRGMEQPAEFPKGEPVILGVSTLKASSRFCSGSYSPKFALGQSYRISLRKSLESQ